MDGPLTNQTSGWFTNFQLFNWLGQATHLGVHVPLCVGVLVAVRDRRRETLGAHAHGNVYRMTGPVWQRTSRPEPLLSNS